MLPCKQRVAGASPVTSTNFSSGESVGISRGSHTPSSVGSIPTSATISKGRANIMVMCLTSNQENGVRVSGVLPIFQRSIDVKVASLSVEQVEPEHYRHGPPFSSGDHGVTSKHPAL